MTLKQARKFRKLKQVELAELANISSSTICRIEKDELIMSKEIKEALEKVLEIPLTQNFQNNIYVRKLQNIELKVQELLDEIHKELKDYE